MNNEIPTINVISFDNRSAHMKMHQFLEKVLAEDNNKAFLRLIGTSIDIGEPDNEGSSERLSILSRKLDYSFSDIVAVDPNWLAKNRNWVGT